MANIWRHYKGAYYDLICAAANEATGEPMAVYRDSAGKHYVRPWFEFTELVLVDEDTAAPRFERVYIDEVLNG